MGMFAGKYFQYNCFKKACGVIICGKNKHMHLNSHLEGNFYLIKNKESKKNKAFHSVYMNIKTA
jgi:hypothetical protein